jgi:Plasma-membrane choline transporter.
MCYRRSISIAIAVLQTAAEFMQASRGTTVQPLVFAVSHGALYSFGALVLAAIYACEPPNGQASTLPFADNVGLVVAFVVVFTLWQNAFVSALSQFMIAHACGEWYFAPFDSRGKKVLRHSLTARAASVGIWYHTGTLAFGSLIVGVAGLLHWLLTWAREHDPNRERNGVQACLCAVNRWALALVDGFLTLISKQAYIQVALLGCGFVHAMKVALAVQIRHPVKLGIIHSVSEVLRFLGTVTVVAVGL